MKKTPYLEVQYHIQENFENHTDEIELLFSHGMPFHKGKCKGPDQANPLGSFINIKINNHYLEPQTSSIKSLQTPTNQMLVLFDNLSVYAYYSTITKHIYIHYLTNHTYV